MNTTCYEKNWRTADNKVIPFSEVSHQHWSNIYWYHLIFQRIDRMPINNMRNTVDMAQQEIEKRFRGEILEWKPVFPFEIRWLHELGMLSNNLDIIDNGRKIGRFDESEMKSMPGITKIFGWQDLIN